MSELPAKPRDVSYLKKDLLLTVKVLQRFEDNWFESGQRRAQGQSSTRLDLENLALLPVYAAIGIPEICLTLTRYVVSGLAKGCNWE